MVRSAIFVFYRDVSFRISAYLYTIVFEGLSTFYFINSFIILNIEKVLLHSKIIFLMIKNKY